MRKAGSPARRHTVDPAAASGRRYPPYSIGIVHYRTYDDLAACLESIHGQTHGPEEILVLDSEPDPGRQRALRARWTDVEWMDAENLGFAAGANRLLSRCPGKGRPREFVLIMNPDVVLRPDYVATLVQEMQRRPEVALATGKLLRPGQRLIDSAGILMPRNRRPKDRGSGEADEGQYGRIEYVFGVSGAAMMLRRSALEDLALDGEVFDEDFFLYHEDTDLAWRARLLGWRALYVPAACAIHARGWRKERRFSTPTSVRRHSFKNHYLQMIKNEHGLDFALSLPAILLWEIVRLAFVLARDREMLPAYAAAWRLKGRAFEKRRALNERIARRHGGGRASERGSSDRGR